MNLWNKNIEHFKNIGKYLIERALCIIFILVSIIIVTFIFFSNTQIENPKEIESQTILINGISLENLSIILGIIGIVFTAGWALYQFDKSKISSQQEKASDIAKIFSSGLLHKCGILIAVFDNSPLKPIIEKIDKPFYHFTTDELREITENDDFPRNYKKMKHEIDFDYRYHRILEKGITLNCEYEKKYLNQKDHHYTTEEARNLFILDNKDLPFHFMGLVDDVLNSLEHICISISSHAAGSTFIYQSLHQMFFDTIKVLSLEICSRNNGKYSDKFYTNIIHVYNEWQKIYTRSTAHEKNKKDKNKKILNPKIKTVE